MTQTMATLTPGPLCPRCRRRVAAWRLDHCIYCGEKFPETIREGFTEPEALKFVDRPDVPHDAVRQLEMMKYVEIGSAKKPRSLGMALVVLSLPFFAAIFYLLYQLASHFGPAASIAVIGLGLAFLGYVGWTVAKRSR